MMQSDYELWFIARERQAEIRRQVAIVRNARAMSRKRAAASSVPRTVTLTGLLRSLFGPERKRRRESDASGAGNKRSVYEFPCGDVPC